jgi:hypothetical protein
MEGDNVFLGDGALRQWKQYLLFHPTGEHGCLIEFLGTYTVGKQLIKRGKQDKLGYALIVVAGKAISPFLGYRDLDRYLDHLKV